MLPWDLVPILKILAAVSMGVNAPLRRAGPARYSKVVAYVLDCLRAASSRP